jgi:hypothetical protein
MNRNAQTASFNLPQTNGITRLGIALLLVTAAIHFIDAPGSFNDAKYKGVLFVVNGIGALIAAFGIWRNERSWGWNLGALVAVSTALGYVLSRTVGLPQLPAEPDAWLEPLGFASLIVELGFVVVYAMHVLHAAPDPELRKASH